MTEDTTAEQIKAASALLSLLRAHPGLPAGYVQLKRMVPQAGGSPQWGIAVRDHDDLSHFEQWRDALGLDPDHVTLNTSQPETNWIEVAGSWSGVPIEVICFFAFIDPDGPQ
ncbi:hypothetical protein [Kitasatospora sp. NPDC088134]|uniref:hypothetical protein n=1 Tax=Kitasatospora sp. NPDC088134 TaxID=3364071 RepID=UPI00380650D7